jgi:5-methylcytosine-specific restriction endonuclease McrA
MDREKLLAKKKRWYQKHREEIRAKQKTYYQENEFVRETVRARTRQWRIDNPERAAANHRNKEAARRARKRNQFIEMVDHQIVWQRDNGVCGICLTLASQDEWHLDHIIPLSKGGFHSYSNTQVAHPTCNLAKGGGD